MTQAQEGAAPPLLKLVVTQGPQEGRTLDSRKGVSLQLGRTAKSALQIKDPAISTKHAEVEWSQEAGCWRLRDVGSSNGTSLNGRALPEGEWAPLKDGDELRLGTETVARVEVAPAVAPDSLTVEEFVLAECAQLEARIRWARSRGLAVVAGSWAGGAQARQRGDSPSQLRRPAAAGQAPLAASDVSAFSGGLQPPGHQVQCTLPLVLTAADDRCITSTLAAAPSPNRAAGRARSRRPTRCAESGRSRSRRC